MLYRAVVCAIRENRKYCFHSIPARFCIIYYALYISFHLKHWIELFVNGKCRLQNRRLTFYTECINHMHSVNAMQLISKQMTRQWIALGPPLTNIDSGKLEYSDHMPHVIIHIRIHRVRFLSYCCTADLPRRLGVCRNCLDLVESYRHVM